MLVVRVTENVRAVQSSYYSSCPWSELHKCKGAPFSVVHFVEIGRTWTYNTRKSAPSIKIVYHREEEKPYNRPRKNIIPYHSVYKKSQLL
jgi:hypothetical protein